MALNPSLHGKAQGPVVIVGTGPVGVRVAQELRRRAPAMAVAIFGNEPWRPYNRVRLSSYLAGELAWEEMDNPITDQANDGILQYHNCAVVSIDRAAHCVVDTLGRRHPYAKLVLAVGSRPHIPAIPGIEGKAIHTFRDLGDAERLMARRVSSRHTVVLGGGLLGLEAARAMTRLNTKVTVVDHATHLLFQQLDATAGALLAEAVQGLGIGVITGTGVADIVDSGHAKQLRLHDGRTLACDTVIVCTGIRPNIDLARQAGLPFGRGITVNDTMCTADPDIYAVGECVEHRGKLYGLVAPGLEQAGVAVHHLLGGKTSYKGSIAATRLKVVGQSVFSMGEVADTESSSLLGDYVYHDHAGKRYRKLVVYRRRLQGVVAYGDWAQLGRIQEAVTKRRYLFPWQLRRFLKQGDLWPDDEATGVVGWPANAVVCQCTGVSRGALTTAIGVGGADIESLQRNTGACTVCGSCRPLLLQLLQASGGVDQAAGQVQTQLTSLGWAGLVALLLAFIYLAAPPLPYSDSVNQSIQLDYLWLDGFWKQFSGYTLLGITAIGLLVSLRKRLKWARTWGDFSHWRLLHTILGGAIAAGLFLHTGMHFGSNLNFVLTLVFLSILLLGGISALAIAGEETLDISLGRHLRKWSYWGHLVLFWPLPVLLGFHILSAYYF